MSVTVANTTASLSGDELVTTTDTQTLTNKTLTSPTINTPTIATPTITTPTMTSPTVSSGGITVTAGGIIFPATQSSSANGNTLDDYEEGTWTPVIGGAGGTSGQTYTTQEGRYIKIGSMVWVAFYALLSAKGTITGNAQIQGLPFTAETGVLQFYGGVISRWTDMVSAFMNIHSEVLQNTTTAAIYGITAGATSNTTALTTAHFNNNSSLGGAFVYRASA